MAAVTLYGRIRFLLGHDAPASVQFVKYAVCGLLATGVHVVCYFLLGWYLLPCLEQSDPLVRLFGLDAPAMNQAVRARYAVLCNIPTFLLSNAVAYLLNILCVFRSGRHSRVKEIAGFYATALVSLVVGTGLQWLLVRYANVATSLAFGVNILVSLAINFLVRKFWIFR